MKPIFRISHQRFVEDGSKLLRQSRQAVADGGGVFVEDDVDGVALGIEAVGEFSGEELIEGGGEAPDVGDGFDVFEVGNLFRRHEDGRAAVVSCHAHAAEAGFLEILGEAEVGDLGAVAVEQDVVRFDVAVDEAFLVGGGEAFERLKRPRHEHVGREGAAAGLGDIGERAAVAVFHDEEEGALVRTAVEEADDVGMLEPGDDLHFAFEVLDGAGFRLGAGKHEFHRHRIAAGFRGGEIDGSAAAATEFALHSVIGKGEDRFFRTAKNELAHGLGREAGEIAFRQGGGNHGGVRRSFHPHINRGLADGDAVAVFQVDAGVLAECALLRSFAFFAAAAFRAVHLGAVHAAEIAQGSHGRAGF